MRQEKAPRGAGLLQRSAVSERPSRLLRAAVAAVAYQRDLATGPAPNDLRALVQSQMYDPHY